MKVDQKRLRADIERTAEVGAVDVDEGRGRTVLTGSDADKRTREYFLNRLKDAGLETSVDAVGNIRGRWISADADPAEAPIASGSHLDSVPNGGIFDGVLGVYAALEAVRSLQDAGIRPDRPIDIVSFTEEEGSRFGVGLLGSSVAAGKRTVDDAYDLGDEDGTSLRSHLNQIGFRGEGRVDASAWDAWLELHVEQGTTLENAGARIGLVDAISGITNCRAAVDGEAAHAGGTSMDERADALTAASEAILNVERAARELASSDHPTAVATVGEIAVEPNARNVVPGSVNFSLDIRAVEYDAMDELVDRTRESLVRIERERPVLTSIDRHRDERPTQMSVRCLDAARKAVNRTDVDAIDLHSAGLHDTAHVADRTDATLLFAPSREGISHNPREWTDWCDCAAATRVLAETITELSTKSAEGDSTDE